MIRYYKNESTGKGFGIIDLNLDIMGIWSGRVELIDLCDTPLIVVEVPTYQSVVQGFRLALSNK